ncbi:MAG TPA: glycoside hydrolase family 3 C-terminal domain-containing protein [Candidatus Scatosoma pullistercoris]|uniref:Glycoside hydrolase family 3 C-terminal domain-containing protein n=1 Tax=Candidatus Scatosoma pullistercoris TaxID=2840934 RepID=A0A9D1ME18_9FIRM|nr:glycoside hydrolase family 3 C-terminal domain-containing protein [Candidatus Scatosoma pullistercoris]
MDIEKILKELTAEEKATLVAGVNFMCTRPVSRLGIPSLHTSDGPHGLRVQTGGGDNGIAGSLPSTAFPTAATTACGWNPDNLSQLGAAIAGEAHKYGVHVVLGPGVNIKRNPLAGRNFEYFSEDPLLAGKLGAAEVRGIQGKGVGVSVKHFALNNSENFRFMGDSVADLRAMREIYLKVFEIVVKESAPATIMCAYNKVNGEYCSQNKTLLTDILRGEWGFDGLVMTDWGAMHDRVAGLKAGLDLEMPGDTAVCRKWIADGLKNGTLSQEDLDKAVANVLRLVEKYCKAMPDDCDFDTNDALACRIAEDCAVLLKNDGILPLKEGEKVFVCGDLFEKMRYQGAGSSMINPTKVTSPKAAFEEMGVPYVFARGYTENRTEAQPELIEEALVKAAGFETALVFAGLTDSVESESCDRENMMLPENQRALVDALVKAGKKIVVVLFGGAPVELPFEEKVNAVLDMYLPGQSGGRACARLLYGRANPAGRLAETWPLAYADVPFGKEFSASAREVYKESVFVGYRYYTTAGKRVRYPFGYGLSYTDFAWSDMQVSDDGEKITVSCTVKNTGERDGAEVVQLYVGAPQDNVFNPRRELRAFRKVYLEAGESKVVSLTAERADLRCFDIGKNAWILEDGEYALQLCSDCCTVRLSQTIRIRGEKCSPCPEEVERAYRGARLEVSDEVFEKMSGRKIPALPPKKPITLESRFTDLQATFFGRILYNSVLKEAKKQMKEAAKLPEGAEKDNKIKGALFMKRILESNSLSSMSMSAGQAFPYHFAQGFAAIANGHLLRGLKYFRSPAENAENPGKGKKN